MLRTILHYCNIFGLLWTLCLCLVNIALPHWVLMIGLYIFFATWLTEMVIERRWHVKPTKEWIFYGLLLVFFLWAFLYWPWDGQHTYFRHHIEQRLPLLGFGIIGLFGINRHYSRAIIINTMIAVSVLSVLYITTMAGWKQVLSSPVRWWFFSVARTKYVNAHMWYNFFLNSTLIGIWYLLFHAERKPALWQKITYPVATVLIIASLLISEGRSGFFTAVALLGMMLIIECYKRIKWLGITMGVMTVAAVIAISATHPRISKEELTDDLRYAYWKSAAELIVERPVLGYGISRAQEEFDQVNTKYADKFMDYLGPIRTTHYIDCHNQYIQTTMEFGIVGLIILLAIYLAPLVICWGKREWWLAFFFTLISMGQSLFDMFLTGRFNMLYCIFLLMILSIKDDYSLSPTPREA